MQCRCLQSSAFLLLALVSSTIAQPIVNVVENQDLNYFDVFYTPEVGTGFTAWDLIVTPTVEGLLDPNTNQRSFATQGVPASSIPLDTFANTDVSAVGFGSASHLWTAYNPGSSFPPVPAQTPPTVGGNPNRLFWTIFATQNCDGPCGLENFVPHHMARIMYTEGGEGTYEFRFFNNVGGDTPDIFVGAYGVPEPSTSLLTSLGVTSLAIRRRVSSN